jgi:hypothetical protein
MGFTCASERYRRSRAVRLQNCISMKGKGFYWMVRNGHISDASSPHGEWGPILGRGSLQASVRRYHVYWSLPSMLVPSYQPESFVLGHSNPNDDALWSVMHAKKLPRFLLGDRLCLMTTRHLFFGSLHMRTLPKFRHLDCLRDSPSSATALAASIARGKSRLSC